MSPSNVKISAKRSTKAGVSTRFQKIVFMPGSHVVEIRGDAGTGCGTSGSPWCSAGRVSSK